jgi:prepilin-type processing-associated H-X9-DG protein
MQEKKKFKRILLIICIFLFAIIITYIISSAIYIPKSTTPKIVCAVNIKSLNVCLFVYHGETEIWPEKENWCDLLNTYFEHDVGDIYQCPADKVGPCSYAMNAGIPADAEELPGDLVVLFESAPGWNRVGGATDVVTDRHGRPGANIAFADGRVEFVEAAEIGGLRWTVDPE